MNFNELMRKEDIPAEFTEKELRAQGWPVDFDFDKDAVCQECFRPFIEEQLKILEAYDAERVLQSDYVFHIHALDAAEDVYETCIELGLGSVVAKNMAYATLIHDIGKPELPIDIWDYETSPPPEVRKQKRTHVNIGADMMEQSFAGIKHPFKTLALDIIRNHHERLDGKGENGLSAEGISKPARLVAIVEDYDGRTHLRAHHIEMGLKNDPESVFARMEKKCDGWFDPELYKAFKEMKLNASDSMKPLQNPTAQTPEPL